MVDLKELGRLAQIFPSWIRMTCRSRVDYCPVELLELWRVRGVATLENNAYVGAYPFIDRHLEAMRESTVESMEHVIFKVYTPDWYKVCPFERSEKKTSCLSCPLVRRVINEIESRGAPLPASASPLKATRDAVAEARSKARQFE